MTHPIHSITYYAEIHKNEEDVMFCFEKMTIEHGHMENRQVAEWYNTQDTATPFLLKYKIWLWTWERKHGRTHDTQPSASCQWCHRTDTVQITQPLTCLVQSKSANRKKLINNGCIYESALSVNEPTLFGMLPKVSRHVTLTG